MQKKFKRPKQKNYFLLYLIVLLIACSAAGYLGLKVYLKSQKPISNLESFKPNIVTKIYSADNEVIKTFTAYKFEKVDIKDIPDNLKNAIIATEDKSFYQHDGYDPFGVVRSMVVNVFAGRAVQGASTITQQLARILFLSNEKTMDRKIKEMIIAARIEKTISKDQILEMYLNNVYLGSGAYGVAGAATIYFNKPLKNLTLAEAALIAGLPQAPSVYSPYNNKKLALKRREQVLNRMYKMQYISKEECEAAKNEELHLNGNPNTYTLNRAPYFVDYVMKELEVLGFDEKEISQGGYKITTTLDYKAQKASEAAMNKHLNSWGLTGNKQQAAVFAFSPITGEVLVYIGGKNYGYSQFDRVSHAVRPPGSSFKPFVFAAAIEKGYTPNDMVDDKPIKINDWAPHNYGNTYRGSIPLYAALMLSSNVVAARLIQDVGIRAVVDMARNLGLSTPLQYDYTIALGSNGVKLYEMTIAYGAFGNGGYKVKPYAVKQIETSRGKIIYQAPKTRVAKVLNINTAATMTAMMKLVITNGTGRAANIGRPAAAKTGTTDDYKDAWFVGFTPDIAAGVWVGNDDNTKMKGLTGGTVPAMIWKDVLLSVSSKLGVRDFDYPPVDINLKKLPSAVFMEAAMDKPEEDVNKEEQQTEEPVDSDFKNLQKRMSKMQDVKFSFDNPQKIEKPKKPDPLQAPVPIIPVNKPDSPPVPTRINY